MNDDDDRRSDGAAEAVPSDEATRLGRDTPLTDGGWASVPPVETSGGATPPPAQQPVAEGTPPMTAWTPQPSPRRRLGRRSIIAIVAGGVAVVLVLVAAVVGYGSGSSHYAPARQVEAFLDQLEAGHVRRALALTDTPTKNDPLLTDAAYAKATGRVTGYRIVGTRTSSDQAVVSAYLRQGSRQVPATFELAKTGTAWGVFATWRMQPLQLGAIEVGVRGPAHAPLSIAGQSVATGTDGTASVKALPGTYAVSMSDGKWFAAKRMTTTVTGLGATATPSPVTIAPTLTAAGEAAAVDAVNAWVDGCVASTDIKPDGCSFGAYGENPQNTYSNQKWTLNTRPTVAIGEWTGAGWLVRTQTPGQATFTADFTGPAGTGVGTAGPITFSADGEITGFTDTGAEYRSLVTGSASGGTANS